MDWLNKPIKKINSDVLEQAKARQGQLTKPAGSLGRLEEIAIRLSAMQETQSPRLDHVHISVFAGDHGVAEEGVSVFPQVVTTEMIKNFARGGAAISVMAKEIGATMEVVDVGAAVEPESLAGVYSERVAAGTSNFTKQPAMTESELASALQAGIEAVERGCENNMQLFIAGEMGIANTTVASAIASALLKRSATELAGAGTGVDDAGIKHKATVIQKALDLHKDNLNTPLKVLQHVGGFEIAAMTGAFIHCAQKGIPVLVDGFIATAAALVAVHFNNDVSNWLFYSHQSGEQGHKYMLEELKVTPLVNLGMRLGEGTGAATVLPILKIAIATHREMATFDEAGVSEI